MPQFGKLGIDFGEKRAENCFKGSENLKLISPAWYPLRSPFLAKMLTFGHLRVAEAAERRNENWMTMMKNNNI